jgi:hypothetical protein
MPIARKPPSVAIRRLRARLKDAVHVGIDRVVRRVGRINIRAELAATTLGHAADRARRVAVVDER